MKLTKLNANKVSNWNLSRSFRNFQENDYSIRTEIGSVGYKVYDDEWSPFLRKAPKNILFESRIQQDFFDDTYIEQVDI